MRASAVSPPPKAASGFHSAKDARLGSRPLIRRFFVDSLLGEMNRLDPRCRRLLKRHNLWAEGSVGLYSQVALADYVAFFEDAAKLLKRPALGLELGQQFRLGDIGPVSHLIASAKTMRAALAVFIRFQRIWQSHTRMEADRSEPGITRYCYRIEDQRIWPRQQDAENVMAALFTIAAALQAPRWTPKAIWLEHDIGAHEAILQKHFRCKINGLSDTNAIAFLDQDLDRPLAFTPNAAQSSMAVIEAHLFELLAVAESPSGPLDEEVARLIAARMGHESVALEDVAAALGRSPRSLRRQLQALGTSFGAILLSERQILAEQLLGNPRLRLEEIALRLGYSSPAVFSRAYRLWRGKAPRQTAASLRGAPAKPPSQSPD